MRNLTFLFRARMGTNGHNFSVSGTTFPFWAQTGTNGHEWTQTGTNGHSLIGVFEGAAENKCVIRMHMVDNQLSGYISGIIRSRYFAFSNALPIVLLK
jgi:hypothetical protein